MTPLNYTYVKDMDQNTIDLIQRTNEPVTTNRSELVLAPQALTPDGSEYFQLVHAYKASWESKGIDVIRFRVLSCDGGITVTIPCSNADLLYRRYRSILERLRNSCVWITFPVIEVHGSKHCLYFVSHEFKIRPETNTNTSQSSGLKIPEVKITPPQPTILI